MADNSSIDHTSLSPKQNGHVFCRFAWQTRLSCIWIFHPYHWMLMFPHVDYFKNDTDEVWISGKLKTAVGKISTSFITTFEILYSHTKFKFPLNRGIKIHVLSISIIYFHACLPNVSKLKFHIYSFFKSQCELISFGYILSNRSCTSLSIWLITHIYMGKRNTNYWSIL